MFFEILGLLVCAGATPQVIKGTTSQTAQGVMFGLMACFLLILFF